VLHEKLLGGIEDARASAAMIGQGAGALSV